MHSKRLFAPLANKRHSTHPRSSRPTQLSAAITQATKYGEFGNKAIKSPQSRSSWGKYHVRFSCNLLRLLAVKRFDFSRPADQPNMKIAGRTFIVTGGYVFFHVWPNVQVLWTWSCDYKAALRERRQCRDSRPPGTARENSPHKVLEVRCQ
jgi:hypothetical protein